MAKPIEFKGQNVIYAKDQPEYLPLPAIRTPDGEVISCWQLSDKELEDIAKNRCIYIRVSTFNQPLQPLSVLSDLSDMVELINDPE